MNYGATELETAALVWALLKLEHFLDSSSVVVVTDHTAIRDTFQSIGSGKPKGKYRLVNWRLFLEKWRDKIQITYRQGRQHINADALSRLPTVDEEPVDEEPVRAFPVAAAPTKDPDAIPQELRDQIVTALPTDRAFRKVYHRIKESGHSLLSFDICPVSGLLRFTDNTNEVPRLCVPEAVIHDVLKMAHDDRAHPGIRSTCDFLLPLIFYPTLRKAVVHYIAACPECAKSKPRRGLPYGDMTPVDTPRTPLSTICLDFVTGLPEDGDADALLLLTDKFTKIMRAIAGRADWDAGQWADRYVELIYPDWGMPHTFVHDDDSRLVSRLWTALRRAANVTMATSAPHHQQANGQAERSVQTLIHALRTVIGARHDTSTWRSLLPHVLHCLNSRTHSSTGTSPFQLIYGRNPNHFLNPAASRLPDTHDVEHDTRHRHQTAWDAVQLATARMKISYDQKHLKPPPLRENDLVYVKLAKPGQDGYHLNNQTKLSHRRAGPFPISKVVSPLRLRLDLPPYLKWHPEISIEHLEPVHAATRPAAPPGPIRREGEDKFIVDKILNKRRRRGHTEYLVRWLGYSQDWDTWEPEISLRQDVPQLLDRFSAPDGPRRPNQRPRRSATGQTS